MKNPKHDNMAKQELKRKNKVLLYNSFLLSRLSFGRIAKVDRTKLGPSIVGS